MFVIATIRRGPRAAGAAVTGSDAVARAGHEVVIDPGVRVGLQVLRATVVEHCDRVARATQTVLPQRVVLQQQRPRVAGRSRPTTTLEVVQVIGIRRAAELRLRRQTINAVRVVPTRLTVNEVVRHDISTVFDLEVDPGREPVNVAVINRDTRRRSR